MVNAKTGGKTMGKRSGIMLCYPFEEKRLEKWSQEIHILQPKLDGNRCRAVYCYNEKRWKLLSSEQEEFTSVPHINRTLSVNGVDNQLELDGELYIHGMSHSEIHSIVSRTKNLHPDYQLMQFHVFDIVNETEPQWSRINRLQELKGLKTSVIQFVETLGVSSFPELMTEYQRFLDNGYEGMIIRNIDGFYVRKRSTNIMKFKPKKSDWYQVVGYKEEISITGEPKNRLGALICCGSDGTQFSVGSGLTDSEREKLWQKSDNLIGKICKVEYQNITSSGGVPRFPIFITVEDAPEQNESNPFLEIGG